MVDGTSIQHDHIYIIIAQESQYDADNEVCYIAPQNAYQEREDKVSVAPTD